MRCLVVLLSFGLCACNTDKIADLEKQNKELATKLEAVAKQNNLDLQSKCAAQARVEFDSEGWDKRTSTVSYINHYNPRLNKCFIEVTVVNNQLIHGVLYHSIYVSDAFEGKDYGSYYGRATIPEGQPTLCDITMPSGEETVCHSKDEFTAGMKQYIE
jgi:hypothetical protein